MKRMDDDVRSGDTPTHLGVIATQYTDPIPRQGIRVDNLDVFAVVESCLDVFGQFAAVPFEFYDNAFAHVSVFHRVFADALNIPNLHFTKHAENKRFRDGFIHTRNAYHGLFRFQNRHDAYVDAHG